MGGRVGLRAKPATRGGATHAWRCRQQPSLASAGAAICFQGGHRRVQAWQRSGVPPHRWGGGLTPRAMRAGHRGRRRRVTLALFQSQPHACRHERARGCITSATTVQHVSVAVRRGGVDHLDPGVSMMQVVGPWAGTQCVGADACELISLPCYAASSSSRQGKASSIACWRRRFVDNPTPGPVAPTHFASACCAPQMEPRVFKCLWDAGKARSNLSGASTILVVVHNHCTRFIALLSE
jgi:hypothetical protein